MKTNKLVKNLERLKDVEILGKYLNESDEKIIDEIIQKLREFDELKRVIHDTVDTAIELYNFLFALTRRFE